jgi:hypothetical protein
MFFELQDTDARKAAHELHARMIRAALVEIFQFPDARAERSVADLLRKYDAAPQRERDFLLHEDPVNLAMEIAGKSEKSQPDFSDRLKRYNEQTRPRLVDEARRLYDSKFKPVLEKLGLEE